MASIDFVDILGKHKDRILLSFDERELPKITEERYQLLRAFAKEPSLKSSLESVAHKPSHQAWEPERRCFQSQRLYAAGLACMMPTTGRVESDISFMSYRKNEYKTTLSDFSLEGAMFSGQLKQLEHLLNILNP